MQIKSYRRFVPVNTAPIINSIRFLIAAGVIGIVTGFISVSFLLLLREMAEHRVHIIAWAQADILPRGILICLLGALMAAIAAAMVQRLVPEAEGSGIPRVEAIVAGKLSPKGHHILPVKYFGGLLSIGSGLALGREGPSVQMGASTAHALSGFFKLNSEEVRTLIAAGAAAGLATAFNAPIAGAIFVLEELLKRFDPKTTLATLTASASAFTVAQFFVSGYELQIVPVRLPQLSDSGGYIILGLVMGVLAVFYNRSIMAALAVVDRSRIPVEVRAALIGLLVAAVGLYDPQLTGGGEEIASKALQNGYMLQAVAFVLLARYILGVASYSALTPGGLFAPMLAIGATSGLLVGQIGEALLPGFFPPAASLALVGMAGLFAGSVQAPVTGIILATEMTGSAALLAPMLGVCAIAVYVSMILKGEPIYDALAKRSAILSEEKKRRRQAAEKAKAEAVKEQTAKAVTGKSVAGEAEVVKEK